MLAGRDSSFQRPTAAMIPAIRAAGVRIWGGYLGTRGGLGLAVTWPKADFDIVRQLGAEPTGFCSGWDDPAAIRALAAAWGVKACVDVEPGIRPDGPWVQSWLDESGAGLYGLAAVHAGRRAAFHIVASYPTVAPAPATWVPGLARPAGPCGWQCRGTHTEFGISVDTGWYDDWFGEDDMALTDAEAAQLTATYNYARGTYEGTAPDSSIAQIRAQLTDIGSAIAGLSTPTVDVEGLAAALAPHLPPGIDEAKLAADLVAVLPGADMAALRAELAKLLGS